MNFELKYYNQEEIWANYAQNEKQAARAQMIVENIPNHAQSIIDIGCGNGVITNKIEKKFVTGVDFATVPLRDLEKNAVCASIDALPFKESNFDLVLCTEVLEHLPDQMYYQAIREINMLKAKYIMITVPFEENLKLNHCKCNTCGYLFNSNHHYRTFGKDWHAEKFPDYEVQFIKYDTYKVRPNPLVLSLKQRLGIYPVFQYAICPECGEQSVPDRTFPGYVFEVLNLLEIKLKKQIGIKKPYHQMLLLVRKMNVHTDSACDRVNTCPANRGSDVK